MSRRKQKAKVVPLTEEQLKKIIEDRKIRRRAKNRRRRERQAFTGHVGALRSIDTAKAKAVVPHPMMAQMELAKE